MYGWFLFPLQGCMDGSICVRRLERDLADGGISCKLVRNYIRGANRSIPSCLPGLSGSSGCLTCIFPCFLHSGLHKGCMGTTRVLALGYRGCQLCHCAQKWSRKSQLAAFWSTRG